MEFNIIFQGFWWMFNGSAVFTKDARDRMMISAARLLTRMRTRRVRSGYRVNRQEYLTRACLDVSDLLVEVKNWGCQWPCALAAFLVSEAGAFLHPEILTFTFVPELPKLTGSLFIYEQLRGEGVGRLAEFVDQGEWMSVAEAMDLMLMVELEARTLVECLLEGLPELFDSL
jgi:hypothetical protein